MSNIDFISFRGARRRRMVCNSSLLDTIDHLRVAQQHAILSVLGNTNTGESDDIGRNGGPFQARGRDHTPEKEAQADLSLCGATKWPEGQGGVCGATQQSEKYDTRTVQGASAYKDRSPEVKINVLPVAPGPVSFQPASPGVYLRRSLVSRHVYSMSYDNIWQGTGRVERVLSGMIEKIRPDRFDPDPEELRRLYLVECMSPREMAEYYHVCRETVRDALRRANIPFRSNSEGLRIRWQKRWEDENYTSPDTHPNRRVRERLCPNCNTVKPLDDFGRNSEGPNGHSIKCKECVADLLANPIPLAERQKRWREAIKSDPKLRAKQRVYRRTHYQKHYRRKLYNLPPAEYQTLLESQDFKCALCHKPESTRSNNGEVRALAVDHDHETGQVRGLLCFRCNTKLGILEDEDFKEAVQDYLAKVDKGVAR